MDFITINELLSKVDYEVVCLPNPTHVGRILVLLTQQHLMFHIDWLRISVLQALNSLDPSISDIVDNP